MQTTSQPVIPDVQLIAPSTSSSNITVGRPHFHCSVTHASIEDIANDEHANHGDEEDEADDDVLGKTLSCSTPSSVKRRRRRRLLPSSLLHLLPPGTPRSCQHSGRSSQASSDETTTSTSQSSSHMSSSLSQPCRTCNESDSSEYQESDVGPRVASPVASPTAFCPTIASALWRPLWPPGEPSPVSRALNN